MKRGICVAVVAISGLSWLPAASPAAVPSVRATKSAIAIWSSPVDEDGRFTEIGAMAMAWRYQDSEEEAFGWFFRSRCTRERRPNSVRVTCRGLNGVGGLLEPNELTWDPAMGSARLSIKRRGETHEATWDTSEGEPWISRHWEACWSMEGGEEESGEGQGAGVFRAGEAEGHALGRRLKSQRRFAGLMTEASVTECRFMSQRSLDALAAGDFDRVRYTYAFPR